jgi:(p)ppGpp synthase/HD superfamily hydrolase
MASTLEDAIILAARAHRGQRDKNGEPYILHPLRVMLNQRDGAARIVAMLHDVVEDTPVTLADLNEYGEQICAAVDCLTRRDGEGYGHMIERVSANPLARRVKLTDLEDNMDPARIDPADDAALQRLAKYKSAWDRLRALE